MPISNIVVRGFKFFTKIGNLITRGYGFGDEPPPVGTRGGILRLAFLKWWQDKQRRDNPPSPSDKIIEPRRATDDSIAASFQVAEPVAAPHYDEEIEIILMGVI